MNHKHFIIEPGKQLRLRDHDPAATGNYETEEKAADKVRADCAELAKQQDMLMAQESHSLLIIFQAMDGAGKDGTIKHVMSALDPQGCTAHNFKQASEAEVKHDYLWRFHKELPARGHIGIFNRSYYEEVLITRVHPEGLEEQSLPKTVSKSKRFWKERFRQINDFERYLAENKTILLKFFLHLSYEKQRERLLERTELPEKQWKFSESDIEDRARWKEYMHAYQEMLEATSTLSARWHIIPADHRWFSALAVADILAAQLKSLKLSYPKATGEQKQKMKQAKEQLEGERG